jgi:hypothetical protein
MLKPAVVTARIQGHRTTAWRQELGQVEELLAQLHSDDPRAQPEDAIQTLGLRAGHFNIGHLLEGKYLGIELH